MPTTLWIDELSREAVAKIRSRKGLRQVSRLKYRVATDDADSLWKRIFKQGVLHCEAEQIELRLGSRRAPDGQALILKAESNLNDLVDRIANNLWEGDDLCPLWPNSVSIPKVRHYLERCLEEEIKDIVLLATFILWWQDQAGADRQQDILLVPASRWGRKLEPYLRQLGLEVRVFDNGSDGFFARLRQLIKTVARPRFIFMRILKAKRAYAGLVSPFRGNGTGPYKVSVPYRRSVDLEQRNDLFWFQDSGLGPESVIVSLESGSYPVDHAELERLRGYGFGCVAHTEKAVLSGSLPVWQPPSHLDTLTIARQWFALKTVWRGWRSRESFWQWTRLLQLMSQANRWQEYYQAENIRVDIGLDYGKRPAVRSIAMDNVGGVRIGLQWSSFERQTSFLSKSDHVFFCWGRTDEHAIRRAKSCSDYLIICGYLYDRYIQRQRMAACRIREQVLAAGAQFVVALFDERITDRTCPIEVVADLYHQFLTECLNDPTLGLIIKSKDSTPFDKLKEIGPLLHEARASGRCLVLEEDSEIRQQHWGKNNIFVVIPAMASDLTVCSSITTSGTESALAGTPAVYYDYLYLKDHPHYGHNGRGGLVFDNLSNLIAAIRDHRTGQLPGLGDHSLVIDDLDPYRDGRAGERIGSYVRWFLNGLNTGHSRDDALAVANTRYSTQWGDDKVVIPHNPGTGRP